VLLPNAAFGLAGEGRWSNIGHGWLAGSPLKASVEWRWVQSRAPEMYAFGRIIEVVPGKGSGNDLH
jgi:hypothetical protein